MKVDNVEVKDDISLEGVLFVETACDSAKKCAKGQLKYKKKVGNHWSSQLIYFGKKLISNDVHFWTKQI